jgi:small subunit ribosomal protein S9
MADDIYYATGKRKTAVARVWMRRGTGQFEINNRPIEGYLVKESDRALALEPLIMNRAVDRLDVKVNVGGGGTTGQAGAIRQGISRALVEFDPDLREPLKKAGFLTRDSRMKERKKYGQPGARARFQYSKR